MYAEYNTQSTEELNYELSIKLVVILIYTF